MQTKKMQVHKSGRYKDYVYYPEDLDDVDDDLEKYVLPDSEREYYEIGGDYSEQPIRWDGSIPTGVSHLVSRVQTNIEMSGSRSNDRSKYKYDVTRKFDFSEIHHGPIKEFNPPIPPICDLYEVQSTYHHREYHKGAVGQWNDLVKKGKLPYKYKK